MIKDPNYPDCTAVIFVARIPHMEGIGVLQRKYAGALRDA
jgi:hypothetical protein